MKRYVRALCALFACVMLAGCEKAPDPAVTTAAPTATATASAETATTTAATTSAVTTAGTALFIGDPDEERVMGMGWSFEDYEKNGIILVPVYKRSGDVEPEFYFMSNVLDLYFIYASTDEEREGFISAQGVLFEEKLGGSKSYREKQVKLREPLTDKASLTEEEYNDVVRKKAMSFAELSPIVFFADTEEYYVIDTVKEPPETTDTAHYERGKSFASGLCLEDYEKNGYPLVAVYDTERNPNKPYFYFPSNVVEIYFSYDSYKKSEEFIAEHSDIIEKKVGENNTIDLKQVKLVKPFTDKDSITYEEYIELQKGLEQQLKELSPIVDLAYFYKIHININPDMIEPQ